MLREGLATEFPWAKRAVDRVVAVLRSPTVSREAPVWAAVSGFGAIWTVGTIGALVAEGLRLASLRDPAAWTSGGFAVAGYAIAIATALRAGGRRGLLWFASILGLRIFIQLATALPGFFAFCERSGECSPLRLVIPYVYLLAGIAVSAIATVALRSGAARHNAFLNGAGAFSLLIALGGLAFLLWVPTEAFGASALSFAVNGVSALAAGTVLRARSTRIAPAALLAALIFVSWLALTGSFIVSLFASGGASQPAALYLSGLADAIAIALGWLAAGAAQRARTTAAA